MAYFADCLRFLGEFRWVFMYPNIDVLAKGVLGKFDGDWLVFFATLGTEDLHHVAKAEAMENAPESLNCFLMKIKQLQPTFSKMSSTFNNRVNCGISRKKKHEIEALAPQIDRICKKSGCSMVLDVGSGLGYLPELLSYKYDYEVIGLESDAAKVKTAIARSKNSSKPIRYIQHFVSNLSTAEIVQIINQKSSKVCISGLHACADLSVTILRLFQQIDAAKSLIIMPCCYHRLKQNEDQSFINFPVSKTLKELVQGTDYIGMLNVPFLRLACQSSAKSFVRMTKEEHEKQALNCLFRAILQDVAEKGGYQVRRLKRKSGSSIELGDPFEAYLSKLKSTHSLKSDTDPTTSVIDDGAFLHKMREKWMQHKGDVMLVEALMAVQVALQSVCENLVLLDRVMFLKENGVDECFVEKITDEGLSPRCHALIAFKT